MKSSKVVALLGSAVYLSPCCATPYPQSQGGDELDASLGNRPVAPIEFNVPQGMLQVVVTFPAGDAHPLDRPQFDRIIESLEDYASFQGRPMAFLTHPIHARTGTIKADLNPVPHEPYLTVGETERWLGELKNLVHSRGDFYDMHIVVRKRGVVAQEGSIGLIHEGDLLASYVSVAVSATAAPAATSLSVPAAVEVIGPGPTFQVA